MSTTPKRIWTTFSRGGEYGGENRELHTVTRNQYGDFLFTLDGGEVWQFTIHGKIEREPTAENTIHLGIGKDSKTGKPCGIVAFLGVEGPAGQKFYNGNLRVLPTEPQAEPENPKRVKRTRRGKEHALDGHDIWAVESILKEIVLGKRPKGTPQITNKQAVKELRKRAKEHYLLKERTMPGQRTLEGYVAMVKKGQHLPGAIPGSLK